MKSILILFVFILLSNCSLDKDSKFWTEKSIDNKKNKKNLSNLIRKSGDITNMTLEEYEIYIEDLTKKSKYPNIGQ